MENIEKMGNAPKTKEELAKEIIALTQVFLSLDINEEAKDKIKRLASGYIKEINSANAGKVESELKYMQIEADKHLVPYLGDAIHYFIDHIKLILMIDPFSLNNDKLDNLTEKPPKTTKEEKEFLSEAADLIEAAENTLDEGLRKKFYEWMSDFYPHLKISPTPTSSLPNFLRKISFTLPEEPAKNIKTTITILNRMKYRSQTEEDYRKK